MHSWRRVRNPSLIYEDPLYCLFKFCFIQQGIKFTEVWHITGFFASTLIWYHTHKQRHATHTRAKRLTHSYKYILEPPLMCSQQLFVFHWINNCWCLWFSKNFSLTEVTYLLIVFSETKFFLWNTKNTRWK